MSARPPRPRVLALAGHDSSGGAGVDADREAIEAQGGEARLVVTCWTRQAEGRVAAVEVVPPGPALEAASALVEAGVEAVKVGLLPDAEWVRAVAAWCRALRGSRPRLPIVVDPVLSSSGGFAFVDEEALEVVRTELATLDLVLTPNLDEVRRLTGERGEGPMPPAERIRLARALVDRGARACLLKGGHGEEDPVQDLVLARGAEPLWSTHPRVVGGELHGSGCRYASTVATALACGARLEEAARTAGDRVAARLRPARVGGGAG